MTANITDATPGVPLRVADAEKIPQAGDPADHAIFNEPVIVVNTGSGRKAGANGADSGSPSPIRDIGF